MPEYIYTDEDGHTTVINHKMLEGPTVICSACGMTMWKKPQMIAVNWNGIPPSEGEFSPMTKEMIRGADERRDEYEANHGDSDS